MSKYTTEVRYICEYYAGFDESQEYPVNQIIDAALPKIFDFSFPIYAESHRTDLERKIIKNYYFREIGEETAALWKVKLDNKLNMIMPYYNQLYAIAAKDYDIFNDVDYIREGNRTGANASTDSSNTSAAGSAESWDLFSDTPQGSITDVSDQDYLTNARKVNGSNSNTENRSSSHSGSDSDEHYERIHGKMGTKSYSELVVAAREAVMNIDMMIVQECSDLFMNIY